MKRLFVIMIVLTFFGCTTTHFRTGYDLKTTYEEMYQALNRFDAKTLGTLVHPAGAVAYSHDAVSPVILQTRTMDPRIQANANSTSPGLAPTRGVQQSLTDSMRNFFNNMESFVVTPNEMDYKIVGDTGIVWGKLTISEKAEGQPKTITVVRHTSTWLKTDGKWHWILFHNTAIPWGN